MTEDDFREYLNTVELYDVRAINGFVRHYYDRYLQYKGDDAEEKARRSYHWVMVATKYAGVLATALDYAIDSMKEKGYDFFEHKVDQKV